MIDLLRIQIPIDDAFIVPYFDKSSGKTTGADFDVAQLSQFGLSLAAGEISYSDGKLEANRLYHPFESLPSSNSTLAFKVRTGGKNYFPFLELNASPAKLLQGHNVYGTDDVEKCVSSLLYVFAGAYPTALNLLDIKNAEISQIDCTYTAHLENDHQCRQVMQVLRNLSKASLRASRHTFETSVLWNAGSAHCTREVYLKEYEVNRQLETIKKEIKNSSQPHLIKQLEVLSSYEVQSFAKNAVRFEAKCKKRMLKRLGIPTRIIDFIKYSESSPNNIVQLLWDTGFQQLFSTFKGVDVNIYDDNEVLEALKAHYVQTTKTGKTSYSKALRVFRFFRAVKTDGIDELKETMPKMTFYRNMAELTKVVPQAYIQNLSVTKNNVVPLVRMINVDFKNQLPKNYVEPDHMSQQMGQPLMKLVG